MLPLKQSTPGLLVSFALLLSALSSDGSQISAQTISADKLFASDRVTDIKISVKESDWDTLRSQSRSFVDSLGTEVADSPFTYVPADLTIDGQLIENVGIRKKGFLGSLDSERPSLKIRFDKYQPQDPVPGLSRLTLNNNKQDPSRICQFLTYKLFNDSGTFSPRCGFVKLTVNGNYLGIYSNVESIKPEFLERGFQDGSGDYFEGTVADFFPDWIQKFEKKNKSASRDHLLEIAKLLNQETLNLTELDKHIDIDAFLKFWAMESLIGFWDGYCSNQNNFFIYENPQNSKLYFIPWGTDSCFTQTTPLPPYRIRPKSVHAKSILPNKLYRNPKTQKRYDETLMSLLETHWKEDDLFAEI
ncbi:MAG: spore coat protein H, partial [Mariniblastus sp.]